ncbi:FMN-linked oxidoreductase [Polyplosphaeria fusca]|uniref:FMN-linked oxidoreductase n=1 Tax=Polyplosphaeria fusca TaxID=682080 RepID=A0A9P4QVH6_9PLEO|nr:FMN-linked oxidoreductase [Polyplosphaeria fusca]
MVTTSDSRLFKPLKLGNISLQHRIALAPLTRFRADDNHVPLPFVPKYYSQRGSVPGTLLITEATYIAPEHSGYPNVPGIWNAAQISAWKTVTSAVHAAGSHIFLQLWALGRAAGNPAYKGDQPPAHPVLGPSPIPLDKHSAVPAEMSVEQIRDTVAAYAQAAQNAVAAGFDGVEIHGANGYLVDQFVQDNTNSRTDEYGGSIERRNRFALEVTRAVVSAIGKERVGIRLSPFSTFQGMRMQDPVPQFSALLAGLDALDLAFVHLVEGRVSGNADVESSDKLDWAFENFRGTILLAGGFTPERARETVEGHGGRNVVVVFGRHFIANPDLVYRIREGVELEKYDRDTFYNAKSEVGYTDRPFSKEFEAWNKTNGNAQL